MTNWQVSGYKNRVAHAIVERGGFLETLCGVTWWMSDACSSKPLKDVPDARTCWRCVKCLGMKASR